MTTAVVDAGPDTVAAGGEHRTTWWRDLLALGGGVLVALSLPPWGLWPLAFAGIATYAIALGSDATPWQRFRRGWLFGLAWLSIGMAWIWFLTAPGYVVASALFASLHGAAALCCIRGRGRTVVLPAAHAVTEGVRLWFPFGGVPLATLGIGQVAGPLGQLARIGGVVLIGWVTLQLGTLAGLAIERAAGARRGAPTPAAPRSTARRRPAIATAAALALCAAALGLATVAPRGGATGTSLVVAFVQGGGEQGTRAIHTDARTVVDRHLAATRLLSMSDGIDLVVWPENVIDVASFAASREYDEVAAEAARLGATFAVGVTEDSQDDDGFTNAQVLVAPDGRILGRYDKVRRVPFGEYMPLRSLLGAIGAPTDLVPRDAVAGTGPAVVHLADGTPLAVAISWEVFFGARVRDGVGHGGQVILNPTNGSSYTWTILQSQQVASSRLRAIEHGRWVVQAAPTGFSAFVTPSGRVLDRTAVSEQAVAVREVPLRTGRTVYSRLGDAPVVVAALVALLGALAGPPAITRMRPLRHAPAEGPAQGPL